MATSLSRQALRRPLSLAALDHLDQAVTAMDHNLRMVTWNKAFFSTTAAMSDRTLAMKLELVCNSKIESINGIDE